MTAYRDDADWLRNGVRSGHLVADTIDELHSLARQLELADRYFQRDAMTPHYQLPVGLQSAADALGVVHLARPAFHQMVGRINNSYYQQSRRDAAQRRGHPALPAAPKTLREPCPSGQVQQAPVQPALL